MRIIFTCGGTAGHIYPAVAVANEMKKRHTDAEIIFVGAKGKMETELVPREGYEIKTVDISSFSRSKSFEGLKHNLKTVLNLSRSKKQAKAIVEEFKPDVVVGTGGYASFPVLNVAAKKGIATAVHESNAIPGLTTKVLSKKVDRVMVAFEDSRQQYSNPEKVTVTGTPVRSEFVNADGNAVKATMGMQDKPVVVSFWGSLGAAVMNKHMAGCMALEQGHKGFYHIHATGKNKLEKFIQDIKENNGSDCDEKLQDIREYIFDMPRVMAAADLIISRAGASTVAEIMACGKPSVLVPSPYVAENHQEKNARLVERNGAAVVITEAESSPEKLFSVITELLDKNEKRGKMAQAARALAVDDAAAKICDIIEELLK